MQTVAFLTPEYPLSGIAYTGGIGTSIKNLADYYILHQIRVVIFIYGGEKDRVELKEGKTFVFIKRLRWVGLGWWINRLRIQKVVNSWIEKEKIELIEVPDWTGISAFVRFNCFTVLKLHGTDTYFCHLEGRKVKLKNFWFEKSAFKNADHIIAVSDFVGKKSCELFGVQRFYEVIHNGINLDDFKVLNGNSQKNGIPIILYFGSIIRKKGLLEIPEIINRVGEKIPKVRLILAGNDAFDIQTGTSSTWDLMKPKFSVCVLPNVEYVGYIKFPEIPKIINQADVCIFPSFAEAFPVSWLEAMAMGKALVSSNIGWSPEVFLTEESGLTSDPTDHEDFAKKIIAILQDPILKERLQVGARSCVRDNFLIENIGAQHIKLLNSKMHQRK
jgi:glycosyltransferase involved in cell wall biosynthesis